MHIYCITMDHSNNYGSNFQAYALQHVIESMDVYGEKCEYRLIPIRHFKEWKWPERLILAKSVPPARHEAIYRLAYYYFRIQFWHFSKQYLHFADISDMKDLPLLNDTADAFVCGSDAIWGAEYNYCLDAFYLDFAKKYKFSYAASFGKANVDEKTIDQIKRLLPSFNEISCREKTGCEVVEKYTGRKAVLTADPVLLLSQKEWDQVAGKKAVRGKYIFVYITHVTSTILDFIRELEQQTGLRVVYSSWGLKQAIKLKKLQVQRPEKWLRLLRDAEYVVTNSFHATAFSVVMHKKFFTVIKGEKGKGGTVRMNDFLQAIGLENRLYSAVPEKMDFEEIDYENADRMLDEIRNESIAFLKRNLEAAYREKEAVHNKE